MEMMKWNEILLPYDQVVNELVLKFQGIQKNYLLLEKHSPIEEVYGRVKSMASILDKANRKNIPMDKITEKIEDIAGIRIICRFVEDINRTIGIIRERNGRDLKIIEEEDYVTKTKSSGYRSYHVTVRYPIITAMGYTEVLAEIQVRSLAMNFWATIEHSLKYKYNGNMPDELQKRLVACAEAAFKLDKEMSTIRDEIMEAQKVIQTKNNLVDEILKNIQSLYYVAKVDKMNQFNMQFIELYQEGNLEKLFSFNKQLKIMAELYKVRFI